MQVNFDFSLEPGKELKNKEYDWNMKDPEISIIMPFYNDKTYIDQSVNSVLNQTFPCFELLIIDDGSTDKDSLKKLEDVQKLDSRIKVFHKENGGPSEARDFGVEKTNPNSKYLIFVDSDDLLDATFVECAYWTIKTNEDATWAYTDTVGFEKTEYTWNKWFNSEKMKKDNELTLTAMIKKSDFLEVNGFDLKEKSVYEDWNLWLKLIAKEKFPVRMNFYGFWYRRKKESESERAKSNASRAMEIVRKTAEDIHEVVEAKQYPGFYYNWDIMKDYIKNDYQVKKKNKTNLLFILPSVQEISKQETNIDFLKKLDDKTFDITVVYTEPSNSNIRRLKNKNVTIYDLTTFLDQKYWLNFITYLVEKNNLHAVINVDGQIGNSMLPYIRSRYPELPLLAYTLITDNESDSEYTKTIINNKITNIKKIKNISEDIKQYLNKTSEEIVKKGYALQKNTDVCKELLTKALETIEEDYEFKCEEYNDSFGYKK